MLQFRQSRLLPNFGRELDEALSLVGHVLFNIIAFVSLLLRMVLTVANPENKERPQPPRSIAGSCP